MVTFTMPPPDSPVTSMFATSACAFSTFSLSACACFMKLPILPRMLSPSSRSFDGTNGLRQQCRTEVLTQCLDSRIAFERGTRGGKLRKRCVLILARGRDGISCERLKFQAHRLAKMARQCLQIGRAH